MLFLVFIVCCICGDVLTSNVEMSKLSSVGSFQVAHPSTSIDNKIYSSRSSNLDDLSSPKSSFLTNFKSSSGINKSPVMSVNFKTSSASSMNYDKEYNVIRYNNSDGSPSRTVILPKIDSFSNEQSKIISARLPTKDIPALNRVRSFNRPFNRTKIFNPPSKYYFNEPKTVSHEDLSFFDDPDDNFVLISDSSRPIPTADYPSDVDPYSSFTSTTESPTQRKYKIRRRKYKKNATSPVYQSSDVAPLSADRTSLKHTYATEKDAKFLNLFTIIQFPNDACSEEGGTCYHELECTGLGGIPTTRCARGYGVCCMIEATCGARTNINNTVFLGTETTMGSCSLSIDKVPCTKQIRLDFLQFELEPPMDGECVKDRLFITGANRNVNVPVLCGSLTGQHIYLDVDEVVGPVVLNLISTRPVFRIKISQVCDGNPMLAPKSCLQYYTGRTGVIRSLNYLPSSTSSSYLNNLNYAVCIGKEPDSCSISYSNESPEGLEFEFDIVNLDEDGSLSVPPRQAGAEVFNCPDDYISISNVRLCGQKLNDGSVQVDFTRNYPVTDTTRGPFVISVRTNEAIVGKGFYLNYEQKSC